LVYVQIYRHRHANGQSDVVFLMQRGAHKYTQVGGDTSSTSERSSLSYCSMLSSKAFGKCLLMRPRNNLHTIAINMMTGNSNKPSLQTLHILVESAV
jgi:hypothetical protein